MSFVSSPIWSPDCKDSNPHRLRRIHPRRTELSLVGVEALYGEALAKVLSLLQGRGSWDRDRAYDAEFHRGFGVAHIGVIPSSVRALRDVQLVLDECSADRGSTADTRATPTYLLVTTATSLRMSNRIDE